MEIIKNISAVLGALLTLISFITIIIKPIRKKIIDSIVSKANAEKRKELIENMNNKIDMSLTNDELIRARLNSVESTILRNEKDRLQQELFDCGARCRRNIPLFPEEMTRIRECYKKYSDELHANGIGHMEYEFINKYYNNQNFNKQ